MKKYTKSIIYGISALFYLDIFFNSNKVFSFLKINPNILSIIALIAVLSLTTLICTLLFRKFTNTAKLAGMLFLVTALIIINEFLFSNSFHQSLDFLVALLLIIPIPLVINDLLSFHKRKVSNSLIPGSLILLVSTLIFFTLVYVPYEDYLMGLPIIFAHHWIRNWLILISIILLTVGVLKKKTANSW